MTDPTQPLKYASDTDYTGYLNVITTVILVLSTLAIITRLYARHLAKVEYSWDDYLAPVGYLGLVANVVANYIMAETHTVSTVPPTAEQALRSQAALTSVGITYPIAVLGGKLSLLFLLRRIFGMRVLWLRIGWWIIFIILFPCWITAAFTFAGLSLAGKMSLAVTFNFAVPTVSFVNTITDLLMLVLPIKMTSELQITWKQRAQVMGIFAIGSAGTVISLVRSVRSIQSAREAWDPRYHVFSEAAMGVAEAGIIVICACLPVTRPLFVRFSHAVKTTISGSMGGTKASAISLRSSDEEHINLSSNVIHRRMDYKVDSVSVEEAPSQMSGHSGNHHFGLERFPEPHDRFADPHAR